MNRKTENNMIVGLDIGTSKVATVVGDVSEDNQVEIVGVGSHPSRGLKKGVVVNIESTVQAIQRSIEEAELMAGCQIHSVYTGIAGSHIRGMNSHGDSWSQGSRSIKRRRRAGIGCCTGCCNSG